MTIAPDDVSAASGAPLESGVSPPRTSTTALPGWLFALRPVLSTTPAVAIGDYPRIYRDNTVSTINTSAETRIVLRRIIVTRSITIGDSDASTSSLLLFLPGSRQFGFRVRLGPGSAWSNPRPVDAAFPLENRTANTPPRSPLPRGKKRCVNWITYGTAFTHPGAEQSPLRQMVRVTTNNGGVRTGG